MDGREFSLAFEYPIIPGTRSTIWPHHGSVVYDNKIWVFGGGGPVDVPADQNVYWSSDGVNWSLPNDNDDYTAPWGPRGGPVGVVFAGAMWLLGGSYYPGTDKQSAETVFYNDVWRSVDGIEWEQVVEDAPWQGRIFHNVVQLGDKLLLMGGITETGAVNDVWGSSDGLEWNLLTADAPWSRRYHPETVVFQDKLWLLGGYSLVDELAAEIWTTTDGSEWQLEATDVPWGPRYEFLAVVFNNELLILGGLAPLGVGVGFYYDDIWALTDAPVVETPLTWQSGDTDQDNQISLSELLRVVQFYNFNWGSFPGFHCYCDSEDGYDPQYGVRTCVPHTSDYNPQDWQISLGELLRLIQFFNSGGYHACLDTASEDGFCVGAG
jgi:hypothetical protein